MSSEKMHKLGWRPKVPWKEGIKKTSMSDAIYTNRFGSDGRRERERGVKLSL